VKAERNGYEMMDGAEEKLQRRPTAYSGDQEGGGYN